jgi:antitoxin CcdA
MNTQKTATSLKKRTNVSIKQSVLDEAKSLDINVSYYAEQGISYAINERKKAKWLEENAQAIESSNAFVEKHGLPLSTFRNF